MLTCFVSNIQSRWHVLTKFVHSQPCDLGTIVHTSDEWNCITVKSLAQGPQLVTCLCQGPSAPHHCAVLCRQVQWVLNRPSALQRADLIGKISCHLVFLTSWGHLCARNSPSWWNVTKARELGPCCGTISKHEEMELFECLFGFLCRIERQTFWKELH